MVDQGVEFRREGQCLIRARFDSGGQPAKVDFPIPVGNPQSWLPLRLTMLALLIVAAMAGLKNRRTIGSELKGR